MKLSNTEEFCISCHEMRDYVYLEYKKSNHYANRTGVRRSLTGKIRAAHAQGKNPRLRSMTGENGATHAREKNQ